jgi:uncharacterized protein DUF4262
VSDEVPKPGSPAWAEAKLNEHGFYVHYVPLSEGYVNAHTHGVAESWPGQLDLQIVVALGPQTCHGMLSDFVARIRVGERFQAGDRVERILTQPVLLCEAQEGPPLRTVLRVLIPDAAGKLPGDEGFDETWVPRQLTLDTSE